EGVDFVLRDRPAQRVDGHRCRGSAGVEPRTSQGNGHSHDGQDTDACVFFHGELLIRSALPIHSQQATTSHAWNAAFLSQIPNSSIGRYAYTSTISMRTGIISGV